MAPPPPRTDAPTSAGLLLLVRALLLERSAHYDQRELVAYLDGWGSALELLQKTDLLMPAASDSLKEGVSACVEAIRKAQYEALADED